MHKTTKDLQIFYDAEADKFSGTRKRHWPEFDYIKNTIKTIFPHKKALKILELGCGDGRLLSYLKKELPTMLFDYTGVDISYNLLEKANQNHHRSRWVHQDMVLAIQDCKPEAYDMIILVASFHHLPTVNHRIIVLDGMYNALVYDGVALMTNRCYSTRFKEQFKQEIMKAKLKSIYTLGYCNRNDIMVPWRNNANKLVAHRLYHMFSQGELAKLITGAGFSHINQVYMQANGDLGYDEAEGRNLITTMRKSIYA